MCTLCLLAVNTRKSRVGISFEADLLIRIDGLVDSSADIALDRSEVVNAIVSHYLEDVPSVNDIGLLVRTKRTRKNGNGHAAHESAPEEKASSGAGHTE
jgi:metal-responsive CopG/Arc/MetJ family transcriptional regulator